MIEISKCNLNAQLFLQDNKDLYAEEAATQRERERQRMLSIPGLIAPNDIQDEMLDSQKAIFAAKAIFMNITKGVAGGIFDLFTWQWACADEIFSP